MIVCEGTQTEPAYLKSVRGLFGFGPNVAVVGTGDDPLSVVRLAAALRDDISMRAKRGLGALRVFDEAWAAFDVESDPARVGRLREAIALAEALAVKVAVCNPCFEYWLLLHLTEHTAAIESPTAAQALLAGRLGTYAKGAPPVPTIATIGDAAARARTTRQRHLGCEGDGNPSTNWDHLMKALAEAGDPGVRARLPQFDTYDESLLRPLCGLARSSPRRGGPKRG